MRAVVRYYVMTRLFTMAFASSVLADNADDTKVRKSVVKIFATIRQPDLYRPWTKGGPQEVTGSGVVIKGHRILTNAHMVNHASQVFVQPDKSSEKLSATVHAIAPGIDLAVLKLDDPAFFHAHPALPIASASPCPNKLF